MRPESDEHVEVLCALVEKLIEKGGDTIPENLKTLCEETVSSARVKSEFFAVSWLAKEDILSHFDIAYDMVVYDAKRNIHRTVPGSEWDEKQRSVLSFVNKLDDEEMQRLAEDMGLKLTGNDCYWTVLGYAVEELL